MRQFIWYMPELDMFCLQSVLEDCFCAFEWHPEELPYADDSELMIYMGEL